MALGYHDINLLLLSLIILYISCAIYGLKKYKDRIVYLLYLVCFFVFLIGKYVFQFFDKEQWWKPFDKEIVFQTILILIISLLSLTIGVVLAFAYHKKNKRNTGRLSENEVLPIVREDKRLLNIRTASKNIFYITLLPTLYVIFQAIRYAQTYGYLELYLSFQGSSIILERLATVNKIVFYMFLATMPRKRESLLIILIYALYSAATLFTGQRGDAVIALLIVFFYLFYRNMYDKKYKAEGEIWISRKNLLLAIGSSPLLLSFLTYWSYIRQENSNLKLSLNDLFWGFFDQQGFSVSVISHSLKVQLPDTNINYTLGPIINFFRNNIITQAFFDLEVYRPQTVEMAMYGNTLSETLSYILMPNVYLSGGGIGNSYLAELNVDFGMIGIVLFNMLIGVILYNINHFTKLKPWVFTLNLLILESLFRMPRSSALRFVTNIFNISTFITILAVYFLARISVKKFR